MPDRYTEAMVERSRASAPMPHCQTRSTHLHIAHVTATFPPYWAGTGNVAYHNARELARRGHAVTVLTAASDGRGIDPVPGVELRLLPAVLKLGNAPLTPALLSAGHFDVIHLHYPFIFGAEMVWALSKLRRIPYVLTYHNDLVGSGLRRLLFDLYAPVSARIVFDGARRLIAVSANHAKSCRRASLFKERWENVVPIPNGVDTSTFRPGLDGAVVRQRYGVPDDAGVILFVGALDRAHHYKGVPYLLHALEKIHERDAVLLVVGDGDLGVHFRHLAAELGIARRVRFAGSVDHELLPAYYAAGDVLVLPSLAPESFGMVLIEAMACGRPIVAHDYPGIRAVVDDGVDGFLVRPGDADELARKVNVLLADSDLRTRMGLAGRLKVERSFDWRVIGERLEQLYLEILGDAR